MAEYNLNYLLKGKLEAVEKKTGNRFNVIMINVNSGYIWLDKGKSNWWEKPDEYNFYIKNEQYKPVWSEIRSEFLDQDGFYAIFEIIAWETNNNDEDGKVIAKIEYVLRDKSIIIKYYDERAKTDINAQEYIEETKNSIYKEVQQNGSL